MSLLLRNVQKVVTINICRIEADLNLLRRILSLENFDLGVICVDDDHIRQINKMYRNVDSPTDVLSFPFHELKPGEFPVPASEEEFSIGDILLGVPYIAKQCQTDGTDLHDICTILLTHGLCHLLGYDHLNDDSWTSMYKKEMDILGQYNKLTNKNLAPITVRPGHDSPL